MTMKVKKNQNVIPAQSAKFQPMASFHPEQVEGSLPIPLGFQQRSDDVLQTLDMLCRSARCA